MCRSCEPHVHPLCRSEFAAAFCVGRLDGNPGGYPGGYLMATFGAIGRRCRFEGAPLRGRPRRDLVRRPGGSSCRVRGAPLAQGLHGVPAWLRRPSSFFRATSAGAGRRVGRPNDRSTPRWRGRAVGALMRRPEMPSARRRPLRETRRRWWRRSGRARPRRPIRLRARRASRARLLRDRPLRRAR